MGATRGPWRRRAPEGGEAGDRWGTALKRAPAGGELLQAGEVLDDGDAGGQQRGVGGALAALHRVVDVDGVDAAAGAGWGWLPFRVPGSTLDPMW
jgi:hypothetical protein